MNKPVKKSIGRPAEPRLEIVFKDSVGKPNLYAARPMLCDLIHESTASLGMKKLIGSGARTKTMS